MTNDVPNPREVGWLHDALFAFRAAGAAPSPDELLGCAHARLEKGEVADALLAFNAAGKVPPAGLLIEAGNACLKNDLLGQALLAFKAAEHKEGLAACADAFLETGWIKGALDAFTAARMDPPQEKLARYAETDRLQVGAPGALHAFLATADRDTLRACANHWLKSGSVRAALAAFEAAGEAPTWDRILSCGQALLEKGEIEAALIAFRAAGSMPPVDELISVGHAQFRKRHVHEALAAFRAAGVPAARDELLALAESCLSKGQLDEGLEAYQIVGIVPPNDRLLACGDVCLASGSVHYAMKSYAAASENIPTQKLIAYAKACMAQDIDGNALEALEAADDKQAWLDCGNAWFQAGKFYPATLAFLASGATDLTSQFRECGQRALKGGWNEIAVKAFAAAGDKDRLNALAADWLEQGWLNLGLEAFRETGAEPPTDSLLACGRLCLEKFKTEGNRPTDRD